MKVLLQVFWLAITAFATANVPRDFGYQSDDEMCSKRPFLPQHDVNYYGQCHCTDCPIPKKEPGVFRVVAVGDSVFNGDHDYGYHPLNMPFQLATMLQNTTLLKDKVEVYNYAMA